MKYVFTIILGILGLALAIAFGHMSLTQTDFKINGDKVDCFDEFRNKIIGQRCIVENSWDNESDAIELNFFLSVFLGIVIFSLSTFMGFMMDYGWSLGRDD